MKKIPEETGGAESILQPCRQANLQTRQWTLRQKLEKNRSAVTWLTWVVTGWVVGAVHSANSAPKMQITLLRGEWWGSVLRELTRTQSPSSIIGRISVMFESEKSINAGLKEKNFYLGLYRQISEEIAYRLWLLPSGDTDSTVFNIILSLF